VKVKRRKN